MGGVLGVSVGSGFVRIVRRREPGSFERRTIVVDGQDPARLAAETIGVLVAGDAESGPEPAVAVAYCDESQAAALDAALRREQVADYRLIPELSAVLEHVRVPGLPAAPGMVVVFDLGCSGSTVSVVDPSVGTVAASERVAACVGLEEAVDLADELLRQSGCTADAVVLVGGGAHGVAMRERLADLAGLPVVVPDDPEFAAASGAALLGGRERARPAPARRRDTTRSPASRPAVSRRQLHGAGAAGGLLVLLAVVGFGLGSGRTFLGPTAEGTPQTTVTSTPAIVSSEPPATSSVPESAPVSTTPAPASADTLPVVGGVSRHGPPTPPAPPAQDPLEAVLDALTALPPLPPLESLPLPPVPLPPLPPIPGL